MTAADFCFWLAEMQSRGLAKSEAECARMLGITGTGKQKMKANGSTQPTALACAALLAGLEPYMAERLDQGKNVQQKE